VNERLQDLFVMTGGVALFVLMGWGWCRTVRLGKPMTTRQKAMLLYSSVFMLGLSYSMMFSSWFKWPHPAMWTIIAAWGVLLIIVAILRHQRKRLNRPSPKV